MSRIFFSILILASFVFLPVAGFAYESKFCSTEPCAADQVGVFMVGITKDCANKGNCTLKDIEQVFASTGNYIIGIVGGLVLLMYVIGGIYILTSAGDSTRLGKGKKYLSISTTGLVIVMIAFAAITTLKETLITPTGNGTDSVAETGCKSGGQTCGAFKVCTTELTCLPICEVQMNGTCHDEQATDFAKILNSNYCTPGLCASGTLCCAPKTK